MVLLGETEKHVFFSKNTAKSQKTHKKYRHHPKNDMKIQGFLGTPVETPVEPPVEPTGSMHTVGHDVLEST